MNCKQHIMINVHNQMTHAAQMTSIAHHTHPSLMTTTQVTQDGRFFVVVCCRGGLDITRTTSKHKSTGEPLSTKELSRQKDTSKHPLHTPNQYVSHNELAFCDIGTTPQKAKQRTVLNCVHM
jgi:hypothetical protein